MNQDKGQRAQGESETSNDQRGTTWGYFLKYRKAFSGSFARMAN